MHDFICYALQISFHIIKYKTQITMKIDSRLKSPYSKIQIQGMNDKFIQQVQGSGHFASSI